MMWLFIFSSFMFFAALISAFMVQTSSSKSTPLNAGEYPSIFFYSTFLIISSSLSMHLAFKNIGADNIKKPLLYCWLTFIMGIIFFIFQFLGWQILIEEGIYFSSSNAGESFVYVFTGAHLLHIIAGLTLILFSIWSIYRKKDKNILRYRLLNTSIFWHFISLIWVYLFLFLLYFPS